MYMWTVRARDDHKLLLSACRHGSMASPWPSTVQNELFEQFTSQNPQGKG